MGQTFGMIKDEFFEVIKKDPSDDAKITELLVRLKEKEPNTSLSSLTDDATGGYNVLQVLFSPAAAAEAHKATDIIADIDKRIAFFRKHVRDFDMNFQSEKTKETLLHVVCRWIIHSGNPAITLARAAASAATTKQGKNEANQKAIKQLETVDARLSDLFQDILAEGPKLDLVDASGDTALMIACSKGLKPGVIELSGANASISPPEASSSSSSSSKKNALTAVCQNGCLTCAQAIVARIPAEMKVAEYHSNDPKKTPLGYCCAGNRFELFEFLIKNNFDISQLNSLAKIKVNPTSDDKLGNFEDKYGPVSGTKFFSNNYAHFHQDPNVVKKCAGKNTLAQAALLQNHALFSILVDSFNPQIPTDALPYNSSILHVVAAFAPKTASDLSTAIDFVDTIREKTTKYSEDGKYDWHVRDSNGLTPFDVCLRANEGSSKKAAADPSANVRKLAINRTFTALVFLETLKHNPENLTIELEVVDPQEEVLSVLNLAPPALAEKVIRLTVKNQHYQFPQRQFSFARVFTNLEELTFEDVQYVEAYYLFDSDDNNGDSVSPKVFSKLKLLTIDKCTKLSKKRVLNDFMNSRKGTELKVMLNGQEFDVSQE